MMKIRKYYDRNGAEVTIGSKLYFILDDCVEEVYAINDGYGEYDVELGINASNPDYLRNHPDAEQEFYPLWQFDHHDYELVKEG